MDDKELYQQWRDKLLQAVDHICTACDDPRKQISDTDNPLNRPCRCPRIDSVLTRAADIDTDLMTLFTDDMDKV